MQNSPDGVTYSRVQRYMGKGRVEAFSDGVIAIIITIMVLELKVPHGDTLEALAPLWPVFLSYVLSFVYIGIYWNNHHHMLHAVKHVSGPVLWANLHLLFWLSLTPFTTAWMGENHFAPIPVAVYGMGLLMNAIAYSILVRFLIQHARPRFGFRGAHRRRHQGLHFARALHPGGGPVVRELVDLAGDVLCASR